ncbi:MAG: group I intron-associated PD-(D/E)XK endonuclease [Candidatus Pacearchaeota archaeon]|jgi:hypothetical protein
MINKDKPDNNNIGNAGEYFIASILSAKGYTTTITLGRAEKYDILAIRPKGQKTIKIQVKTAWYDNKKFRLTPKDGILDKDLNYFYAFVTLKENKEPWDYYIIPARIVAKYVSESHKSWLSRPNMKGGKHNDSSVRCFSAKLNVDTPKWLSQELIDSFKNNIEALEK